MRAFVDASLVLDLVEENDRGARFTKALAEESREWCISGLVRMECRVRALAENDRARLSRIDAVVSSMHRLALTDEVFERAAEIRARTGLKTPDAVHVATALAHGCAELWTADARMARATASGLAIRLVA